MTMRYAIYHKPNRKEAVELANQWNESYKRNGTYKEY